MVCSKEGTGSRVCVVMTTCNGEEHIINQLRSLADQTRPPDDVFIFDDGSEDGTREAVHAFIQERGLQNWHVFVNRERLGWKRNFMEGIRKSSGDLIFLCDQDDVWYPEKISRMTEAIDQNADILLLACDYRVVYEDGAIKAKVYRKNREEKKGLVSRYLFTKHFFMNPNPGCTYVLRRGFFDQIEKLWFSQAPHDEFFWLMAALQDGAYFYNQPLMDFVRYGSNASSVLYKDVKLQLENLTYISEMLSRLEAFAAEHPERVEKKKTRCLAQAQKWCAKRVHLMKTRNPVEWVFLFPWWGYYNSLKNCLSDLYLVLFGRFTRSRLRHPG